MNMMHPLENSMCFLFGCREIQVQRPESTQACCVPVASKRQDKPTRHPTHQSYTDSHCRKRSLSVYIQRSDNSTFFVSNFISRPSAVRLKVTYFTRPFRPPQPMYCTVQEGSYYCGNNRDEWSKCLLVTSLIVVQRVLYSRTKPKCHVSWSEAKETKSEDLYRYAPTIGACFGPQQ